MQCPHCEVEAHVFLGQDEDYQCPCCGGWSTVCVAYYLEAIEERDRASVDHWVAELDNLEDD